MFHDDLLAFGGLTEAKQTGLIDVLNKSDTATYAAYVAYTKACSDLGIDGETAERLFAIITFVIDTVNDRKTLPAAKKYIEELYLGPELAKPDIAGAWQGLIARLPRLEELAIQRKAMGLKEVLPRIKEFSLIVDIRPVFNLDRSKIHHNLPAVILRVDEKGKKGRTRHYDLTESQLHDMKLEIDSALDKLRVLRSDGKYFENT